MDTHAKRFRFLLEKWGLTQEELGHLCGLKRGTVGTIINGRTTPDADALAELLRNKPKLNPDWLLTGNGPVERDGPSLMSFPAVSSGSKAADDNASRQELQLRDILTLLEQLKQSVDDNRNLYEIIKDLQVTNRTSQEQISHLLGKPFGSYPADASPEPSDAPRARAGLRFYDEPAAQPWGMVRLLPARSPRAVA